MASEPSAVQKLRAVQDGLSMLRKSLMIERAQLISSQRVVQRTLENIRILEGEVLGAELRAAGALQVARRELSALLHGGGNGDGKDD